MLRGWNADPDRLGPPRGWEFLITVVNCGNAPRIRNPPCSVEELQAAMRTALGIESEELANEAIVTGFDGPKRRPIETDDDLQEFWESVATDVDVAQDGTKSPIPSTLKEDENALRWQ